MSGDARDDGAADAEQTEAPAQGQQTGAALCCAWEGMMGDSAGLPAGGVTFGFTGPDAVAGRTSEKPPIIQHRSGGSNRWATPRPFAAAVLASLRLPPIALDLAAEALTALAPRWYGPGGERADALDGRPWDAPGGTRWCNPPYSRSCRVCRDGVWRRKGERPGCAALGHASTTIEQWVTALCEHGNDREAQVSPIVALVPANTDTGWWAAAMASAAEVWFITGRLRFLAPGPGGRLMPAGSGAGFGSALLVWDGPIGRTDKRWVPLRFGMLGADGRRVDGSRHGHGPRGST